MENNRNLVSSGNTVGMDNDRKKWFSEQSAADIGWEELLKMKMVDGSKHVGELPIDWILSAPKTVPFYRFMVSYLVYSFWEKLNIHSTKEANKHISHIYEELQSCEDFSEKTEYLADLVMKSFVDNGCAAGCNQFFYGGPEENAEIWTAEKLRAKLFQSTEMTLREFTAVAFGLNMTLEDFNLFLQKALLRGALDICCETDMLLYLTFAIAKENKREFFQRILRQYLKAMPEEDSTNQINPRATDYIRNRVQTLVRRCKPELIPKMALEKELDSFFKQYKADLYKIIPQNRSVVKRFWELLEEFRENESKEITEFKTAHVGDEFGHGNVSVFVKGNVSVFIPKGTLWSTELIRPFPEKNVCDPRICISEEACLIGSAEDDSEITIPVRCAIAGCGMIAGKQVFTSKLPALEGVQIYNKSKFKPKKSAPEYIGGNLFFNSKNCKGGFEIPEGTEFYLGNNCYLSTETVRIEQSGMVPIRSTTPNTAFQENSIRHILGDFPGKEFIREFHNGTISPYKQTASKSEHANISAFLYEYEAHILANFDKERAWDDELILDTFDENYTAQKLYALLRGTALYSNVLSSIRKKYGTQPYGNNVLPSHHGELLPKERWENMEGMITRNRLLVAAFLAVGSRNAHSPEKSRLSAQEILGDSVAEINEELRTAGFHELYLPNPFDCLIAYLTMCADPIESYRTLFDLASDYHAQDKAEKKKAKSSKRDNAKAPKGSRKGGTKK